MWRLPLSGFVLVSYAFDCVTMRFVADLLAQFADMHVDRTVAHHDRPASSFISMQISSWEISFPGDE